MSKLVSVMSIIVCCLATQPIHAQNNRLPRQQQQHQQQQQPQPRSVVIQPQKRQSGINSYQSGDLLAQAPVVLNNNNNNLGSGGAPSSAGLSPFPGRSRANNGSLASAAAASSRPASVAQPLPPLVTDLQPQESEWQAPSNDVAKIVSIDVMCEKSFIKVSVTFDRPFRGIIFSKGFYSNPSCVHLAPSSLAGVTTATFEIRQGTCGLTTSGNVDTQGQPNPAGSFVENTIIIQYDPQVQEVWDQARRLRCTWYDYYEKAVTFKPFQVNMLNAVTANFLGDSLQCWMQIQVGKGPWASEVSGIVKIGQTMTMVLGIKDEENKFDMLVRNCVAHDGKRAPIQLVDELGCVKRSKIMSSFQKIKNFGSAASVVSYAYFQAFKFPDSMNVHFQCVIQVCRFSCPEPQCSAGQGQYRRTRLRKRALAEDNANATSAAEPSTAVTATNSLHVLSPSDVAFRLPKSELFIDEDELDEIRSNLDDLCVTFPGASGSVLLFFAATFVTCLCILIFAWPRRKPKRVAVKGSR